MESFLIYLFKASALLGIFFLCYLLLLQKETSFQLNRKYLLAGLTISFILPAIYFTRKVYIQANTASYDFLAEATEISYTPIQNSTDWWQITGIIYIVITGFFILRLGLQLRAVLKIILTHSFYKNSGLRYLENSENQLPFSFFNYIIFNPEKHSVKELELILEHEKVHARQLHSVDVLIVNLLCCILWFNPFAWLYKKLVEQNLEFIADRETVDNKAEIKEYQRALVKVSTADLKPALTNHFYQSFIKKRILMLNKKSSTQSPAWKVSFVMPLLLAFMLLFNVNTEAQVVTEQGNQANSEKTEKSEAPEEMEIEEEIEINEKAEAPETEIEIHESPEITWTTATRNRGNGFSDLGNDPLYILNGEKFKASKLKNKYIGLNSGIEILVGDEAVNQYGEDAKNGVIIIPDAEVIRNFNREMKDLKQQGKFNGKYIMVGNLGKPNFMNINSSKSKTDHIIAYTSGSGYSTNIAYDDNVRVRKTRKAPNSDNIYVIRKTGTGSRSNNDTHYEFRTKDSSSIEFQSAGDMPVINSPNSKVRIISQDGKPLYMVDDEIQNKEFVDLIDPEEIASIMVLKGDNAIKEYGEKGKNGIIKIRTKKYHGENNDSTFLIRKSFNDDQIKALKSEVENKTGYTLNLMNIERNKEGLITNIQVKFHKQDRMVQSNYSDINGVPDILFGLKEGGGLLISASK
ncbi:M56 family metallopeptidase [Gramella sp. MAR_2010_147]|uniref:M56 family metallopeptidase n=1 Tax=Gramella sp. MAR_2010_147 TaxID=1250205 RepID=UPI00087A6A92|nr:M56 family metallopeptidase [Gramella sp. MAR_2010_147]SDS05325.1 Signal transducer regulating beta-lactamase production, contains metallopeptidase domain [Gramella sp. MAR_2010_147]